MKNSLEIVNGENLNLNKNLLGGKGGVNILKVRTHKGGSSQMRTIVYKGKGGLILAIFVRTYYVDDPDRLFARIASLQAF